MELKTSDKQRPRYASKKVFNFYDYWEWLFWEWERWFAIKSFIYRKFNACIFLEQCAKEQYMEISTHILTFKGIKFVKNTI